MATNETTCRFEELDHGVLAFTLRPELNEVPWTDIERIGSGIVDRVAARGRPQVLVDLSELNHLGSALVALVVRIWKTAAEKGGRMVVVNRSSLVGEVLRISGLANKWTIVSDRGDALVALGSDGRAVSGRRGSRVAVLATTVAAASLVLAGLLVADAASRGMIADRIGAPAPAWAAAVVAVASVAASAVGIARGDGGVRLAAVSLATLAAVVTVAAGIVALRQSAPKVPSVPRPVTAGETPRR